MLQGVCWNFLINKRHDFYNFIISARMHVGFLGTNKDLHVYTSSRISSNKVGAVPMSYALIT